MRAARTRAGDGVSSSSGGPPAWNHAEFVVQYPSLHKHLAVGGVYLNLLLDGADQAGHLDISCLDRGVHTVLTVEWHCSIVCPCSICCHQLGTCLIRCCLNAGCCGQAAGVSGGVFGTAACLSVPGRPSGGRQQLRRFPLHQRQRRGRRRWQRHTFSGGSAWTQCRGRSAHDRKSAGCCLQRPC